MKQFPIILFLMVLRVHAFPENISADYSYRLWEIDKKSHYSQPWKVHEIAQDFNLLDVWEYPIRADKSKGQDFLFFLKMTQHPPPDKINRSVSIKLKAARLLISLRMFLGKILDLDKNINTLPIPGCQESSIRERLSMKDRKRSLELSELGIKDSNNETWRIVYLYEDEMLTELSIDAVHVLMHLGWVHKSGNFFTARLAVYAKPRGMIGDVYMKLIMPFRRTIIYPALMENVKNTWQFYNKK
ncbi:MAG: DUF2867 domain-containing protein [Candidatus Aminicenantes bacterium]|nr:DUF2867 domain-containing protein [Candidatus Aminicenantes bacterium]